MFCSVSSSLSSPFSTSVVRSLSLSSSVDQRSITICRVVAPVRPTPDMLTAKAVMRRGRAGSAASSWAIAAPPDARAREPATRRRTSLAECIVDLRPPSTVLSAPRAHNKRMRRPERVDSGRMKGSRGLTAVLLLALAFLVARFPLHRATFALPVSNDDAVLLLMARHILGGELATILWNQPYNGALDAYLLAPFLVPFHHHL